MIAGEKTLLRNKRVADARDDYTWQTDLELARLDASPQLTASFTRYLLDFAWELRFPSSSRQRFAIETRDGIHIGNCSYYNINKGAGEAELGIMIGRRDYWSQGYGTDATSTLVNHIFGQTGLDRIYLKTLESNTRAQRCFTKCGFTLCGNAARDGYSFLLMELCRENWQHRQKEQPDTASPA